jgi:hypothetical protein
MTALPAAPDWSTGSVRGSQEQQLIPDRFRADDHLNCRAALLATLIMRLQAEPLAAFFVETPKWDMTGAIGKRLYLWSYDRPTLHEAFSAGAPSLATGQFWRDEASEPLFEPRGQNAQSGA